MNTPIYTMQDWERDGIINVQVGQAIEDKVFYELRDCVPPAYLGGGLFQVGEPAGHDAVTYLPLYDTYQRLEEGWRYPGRCLLGKTERRIDYCEAYFKN